MAVWYRSLATPVNFVLFHTQPSPVTISRVQLNWGENVSSKDMQQPYFSHPLPLHTTLTQNPWIANIPERIYFESGVKFASMTRWPVLRSPCNNWRITCTGIRTIKYNTHVLASLPGHLCHVLRLGFYYRFQCKDQHTELVINFQKGRGRVKNNFYR